MPPGWPGWPWLHERQGEGAVENDRDDEGSGAFFLQELCELHLFQSREGWDAHKNLKDRCLQSGARLCSVVPSNEEQWPWTKPQEVSPHHEKEFLYIEAGRALKEAAQEMSLYGCGNVFRGNWTCSEWARKDIKMLLWAWARPLKLPWKRDKKNDSCCLSKKQEVRQKELNVIGEWQETVKPMKNGKAHVFALCKKAFTNHK